MKGEGLRLCTEARGMPEIHQVCSAAVQCRLWTTSSPLITLQITLIQGHSVGSVIQDSKQ